MEGYRDNSVHYTAIKVCEDLQNTPSFKTFFENVQKLVATSNVKQEDFKASLLKAMVDNGLEAELRNSVYHWIRTKTKDSQTSTSFEAYLKKTQNQWEKRIHKSLNSMGSELSAPLATPRQSSDKEEIQSKWIQLSNYDIDKEFRYMNWINFKKALKLFQRNLYTEFARGELVMGVNVPACAYGNYAVFESERISLGEKVIMSSHAPVSQEYLKRGCPTCLRAKMWTIVLGADVKPNHYEEFEKLKTDVLNLDLMSDKLVIKDIHLTASNDDQYFVFEDVLYQVLLCFTRDSQVLKDLPDVCQLQVTMKTRGILETVMTFPPNGVIPFHGFTMYAAPFCYLYDDPVALYQTFKAMYTRYFHKLHKVSGSSQGVVALCLLYERLLQCHEPSVWLHFKQLNIPP
ncbi:TBC1 domain family member 19 [Agrilus planipennis]|uniref:TBC1 domain family member 19 n=1 Tax=Agrilus planipennis TaxID=224129 RepID=A0A7F5RHQ2_AGRPL|nr:TBC1 domain family member 19 [Agrilus planipennis]